MRALLALMMLASAGRAAARAPALQPLIDEADHRGAPRVLGRNPNEDLGLEDSQLTLIEISPAHATDEIDHAFGVDRDSGVIRCVVFYADHKASGVMESYMFRANVEGKLERADKVVGTYDEKTRKPVPGSTESRPLDVKNAQVRAIYRHELDFWLRGKYRKQG